MLKDKTKKYLNKNIQNELTGKTVVVTGANSGVGLMAVEELLYLGANIIMACRNEEKANQVRNELLKEYENANILVYPLDLASLDSIKRFVMRIKRNKVDIYAFVNNAGVYHIPKSETADGFEKVIGTNYIGTYALCERLIPYFKTLPHDVKLINTTSLTYKNGKIDYEDFFLDKKYKMMKAYARSKLCIVKYSIFLANTLMDSNISVLLTHPGAAPTPLALNSVSPGLSRFGKHFLSAFMTVEKAALAIPYAIGNSLRAGSYVGPTCFGGMCGKPKLIKLKKKAYYENNKLVKYTDNLINGKNEG